MIKELRRQFHGANITPIDYDPGTSVVNQLNRIRLMMATANKNLAAQRTTTREASTTDQVTAQLAHQH
jgi:predicted nucleotide-binding protein (sugar kinase/HSP70/actin superfamily)